MAHSYYLRIKVDGDEVRFLVTNDERLRQVKAARFVDAGDPTLINFLLKTTAATKHRIS